MLKAILLLGCGEGAGCPPLSPQPHTSWALPGPDSQEGKFLCILSESKLCMSDVTKWKNPIFSEAKDISRCLGEKAKHHRTSLKI